VSFYICVHLIVLILVIRSKLPQFEVKLKVKAPLPSEAESSDGELPPTLSQVPQANSDVDSSDGELKRYLFYFPSISI